MGGDGSIRVTSAAHRDLHTLHLRSRKYELWPVILIIPLIVWESSQWRFMAVGYYVCEISLTFKSRSRTKSDCYFRWKREALSAQPTIRSQTCCFWDRYLYFLVLTNLCYLKVTNYLVKTCQAKLFTRYRLSRPMFYLLCRINFSSSKSCPSLIYSDLLLQSFLIHTLASQFCIFVNFLKFSKSLLL